MQFGPLPRAVLWLLVPLCYYAGAKIGVSIAVMPEGVSLLWLPNGVLLAAMLLTPPRHIPAIAALGIAAEVAADLPTFSLPEALIFGFANAIEATLACLLLKAWRFDPRLATLADLRKFLLAGPLVAALVAAAIGAAAYSQFRGAHTSYLEFMRVWWMGDAMGLLILTPLLLSLASGRSEPRDPAAGTRWGIADGVVVLVLGVLALTLVSVRAPTLLGMHVAPVLMIPCIVYLAARFDLRVVSASVAVVGVAIAYATAHGQRPFGDLPPQEATARAQEFILSMSLLALGLASLLAQLRARHGELRLANLRLDEANARLESRVAERTAQLEESNRQLQSQALTDALTGLANRRAFSDAAQGAVELALRHGRPLALLMIDIDHFKSINDLHGHAAGDAMLQHVATTLRQHVRDTDTLARFGGEEFTLIAPETDLHSAMTLAHRMGDALRNRAANVASGPVTVTASFGVSALGGRGDDLNQLIRRADAALYKSKSTGRDRVVAVAAPRLDPALPPDASP